MKVIVTQRAKNDRADMFLKYWTSTTENESVRNIE